MRALKAQQKREYQEVGRVAITPRIHFGPEDRQDMKEPHNDSLVITTDISGFDDARIFVDKGSSADIMFLDCFKRMNLEVKLETVEITLYVRPHILFTIMTSKLYNLSSL
ncbi:hypothetical protein ACS0TY_001132 [Phlomoides rotata]